jgi:hypothetical protein
VPWTPYPGPCTLYPGPGPPPSPRSSDPEHVNHRRATENDQMSTDLRLLPHNQESISRAIYGLSKVLLGPAMPYHSTPCRRPPLKRHQSRFRGGFLQGRWPAAVLLPPWIPHAIRACAQLLHAEHLHSNVMSCLVVLCCIYAVIYHVL